MFQKFKKNSNLLKNSKNNKFYNLFLDIFQLKNILRTGWIKYHGGKEEKIESVAEHTFSMSILSYLIAKEKFPELDADKVLKMALFHEIGEIYLGDISVHDKKGSEKEIIKKEIQAFKEIFKNFKVKKEIVNLFEEFEKEESREAKFVKDMDKLEAVFQARFYMDTKTIKPTAKEFKEYTLKKLHNKKLKNLIKDL